jgi:hypothetical protein
VCFELISAFAASSIFIVYSSWVRQNFTVVIVSQPSSNEGRLSAAHYYGRLLKPAMILFLPKSSCDQSVPYFPGVEHERGASITSLLCAADCAGTSGSTMSHDSYRLQTVFYRWFMRQNIYSRKRTNCQV